MFLTCQVKRIRLSEGLPNITGSITKFNSINSKDESGGALTATKMSSITWYTDGGAYHSVMTIELDASLSNSVYGNSSTVTPKSTSCMLILKY